MSFRKRIHKIIFLILTSFPGAAMPEGLFLNSYNEVSERYAGLDEFNLSGVLYLTKPKSQEPIRDAVAYIQYEPLSQKAWRQKVVVGEPPTLHKGQVSKIAIIEKASEQDFSFLWSTDGNSVALLYRSEPIAFVTQSKKYGFSKAVVSDSPVVSAWDSTLFVQLFE
tara:strand:- start:243 stop:740 length:498 start_codon:yes stop_codon:yes gene_type:complete